MQKAPVPENANDDFVMNIDGNEVIEKANSPQSKEKKTSDKPLIASARSNADQKKVTFCMIFSNPKVVFGCFSGCLAYFTYSQMEPILALRLKEFNLSAAQLGLFFAILPIFYMTFGMLVQLQPKWIDARVYLITGAFIGTIGCIFNGPSEIL